MAFRDYRKYTATELNRIFQIDIRNNVDLFGGFVSSGEAYNELQTDVNQMSSRLRLSKYNNEATRRNLMVSRILWQASPLYELGLFFESEVTFQSEAPLNFPHPLSGCYDGALSLDEIDLISPVISVVTVVRNGLSDGLGQCIAEMYMTLQVFQQEKVYGIITDGELWEFLLLENAIVSVDLNNYYSRFVADIVDRIGYIAASF